MQLSRIILLPLWILLTLTAYYLLLFTNWAGATAGSSLVRTLVTQAVIVLAAGTSLEVMRSDRAVPVRAIAGAVGFPLVLVVLLTLGLALRRYLWA